MWEGQQWDQCLWTAERSLFLQAWQVLCVIWGSLASQPLIILWSFWGPLLKLHDFWA